MLDDAERKGHACIVNWNSDGKSLTIHPNGLAVVSILGTYFRQTKYNSSLRHTMTRVGIHTYYPWRRHRTVQSSTTPTWVALQEFADETEITRCE
mmetsp:Transcript_29849/g.33466  ORF Transcript_29849/g.33466 Transcript_29849/m.33466 type:complete len:95 (-) Transcript_29849:127-411(-)